MTSSYEIMSHIFWLRIEFSFEWGMIWLIWTTYAIWIKFWWRHNFWWDHPMTSYFTVFEREWNSSFNIWLIISFTTVVFMKLMNLPFFENIDVLKNWEFMEISLHRHSQFHEHHCIIYIIYVLQLIRNWL